MSDVLKCRQDAKHQKPQKEVFFTKVQRSLEDSTGKKREMMPSRLVSKPHYAINDIELIFNLFPFLKSLRSFRFKLYMIDLLTFSSALFISMSTL